jgi:integrase
VRVERGIYRSPSTGRLEIEYTDATGRVRWKTVGGSLVEARRARSDAQRRTRSFAAIAEEWLAVQTRVRPLTYQGYSSALRRHLLPRIGDLAITAIDERVIAQIISELEVEGLSGWTIRNILVPLGGVLRYAARQKLIPSNPIQRLESTERPRVDRRELRILRADEINALLQAAPLSCRLILATAVFTGLRQGELLGLVWADVDLRSRLIHVRRQYSRTGSYSEPKTPRSRRTVPLNPSLANLFSEHLHASPWPGNTDPVFASETGHPMPHRTLQRELADAVAAAGINRPLEPRLRFHDLRHTYAALLIAHGLNIVYISRQLGHTYPSTTLDNYGDLFDRAEHLQRATKGLEAEFPSAFRFA